LVSLGFSFIVLNIYPWITLPRGFVNAMAAFFMARFAEKNGHIFCITPENARPWGFAASILASHRFLSCHNGINIDIDVKRCVLKYPAPIAFTQRSKSPGAKGCHKTLQKPM
jgi:hypothetical protein